MDLLVIHNFIDYVLGKERAGNATPERKDDAIHIASLDLFRELLPTYGTSQESQDSLSPFRTTYIVTNSNSPSGLITMPSDYEYLTGINVQSYNNTTGLVEYKEVEVLNDDEIGERLRSHLVRVTIDKPVAQKVSKYGIQLYPKVPNSVWVTYLKTPTKPQFVYTESGRGIVYQQSQSKQLEWSDFNISKIMIGALKYIEANLGGENFAKYLEQFFRQ